MRITHLYFLCFFGLILNSCGNSLDSATDSITGNWNIVEIQLYNSTENVTESNTTGMFTFNADKTASYSYLYIGNEEFECEFGDQTSDAHQNAKEIRLLQVGSHLSPYTDMVISLTKA